MRIARLAAGALAATILAVLAGGPAWAHNSLVEATPQKNAKLAKAPDEVRLKFLQKLDARYLTMAVTDAEKQEVALETPKADGKIGTVAFTEPLPNGTYTVAYRVVSVDGHPVQGTYSFTVDGPVTQAPSAAPTPTQTEPAAQVAAAVPVAVEKDGLGWWPVAAGGAGVVLLGAIALLIFRRRPQ